MGERTSHAPGTFSWADLGTDDAEGAKAFYGELFGWRLEDNPVPDAPPYSMALLDGKAVAAIYERRDGQGPPAWLSYVTVEDADATAARAAELGATPVVEPMDVMDAGRMAVLMDPTGAVFAVWQPGDSIGAELVNDAGAMTINQLNTGDPEAAQRFYGELFGWRFDDLAEAQAIEPRGDGEELYWGIYNGERLNGGMMPLSQAGPGAPPAWVVFFTTVDLDASVDRIGALGGGVMFPPTAIGEGRIAVAHDPQGAVFALFEGEVDD